MNGNGPRRRCRRRFSVPGGPFGAGQGREPWGGGRGRCFGGGRGGRFTALERDTAGGGRGTGSPWDVVEALERRIGELEARLASPAKPEGASSGDRP